MLILPFFLAVVFGLLMFVMLVFKGQMLTYATYMAGRVAAVKHPTLALGDARTAARQVLPGVGISTKLLPMPPPSGPMTIVGAYRVNPLVNAAAGSSLNSGMSAVFNLDAEVDMHHFQSPKLTFSAACDDVKDDNCYTQF